MYAVPTALLALAALASTALASPTAPTPTAAPIPAALNARWGSSGKTTVTYTTTATAAGSGGTCDVQNQQCCNSVASSDSTQASSLLALLGVVLQGTDVPIGITCNPISVIGAGSGGTCTADPVCCENDSFSGIIAIGCTPIDLSL